MLRELWIAIHQQWLITLDSLEFLVRDRTMGQCMMQDLMCLLAILLSLVCVQIVHRQSSIDYIWLAEESGVPRTFESAGLFLYCLY